VARRVSQVFIDNHVLGCWRGRDRAMAAVEEAAVE
jgi:hypothetical protein